MLMLETLGLALFAVSEYRQLTSDHSLVNALLRAGQITEEEAAIILNVTSSLSPLVKR